MYDTASRSVRLLIGVCAFALTSALSGPLQAQKVERAPNYDLAAQWTPDKVRKMVFDTAVTPRWLEKSDRFWYVYQTRDGRRFYFVDPVKKTKAPLFDHAKMASALTSITRLPYDAHHLPFSTVRFAKKRGGVRVRCAGAGGRRHRHSTQARDHRSGQPGARARPGRAAAARRWEQRRFAPDAYDPDAALRVRPGAGQSDAARGLQGGAAAASLGVDVARRQNRGLRASTTTSS